jgi:hypothetical protein
MGIMILANLWVKSHTCEGMVCTGVGVVFAVKTHGNTMINPSGPWTMVFCLVVPM